ncbi:MAG: prephenate dehydrogenase [Pseudomonadales bacterium]
MARKLVIVGAGLIGASFARGIRDRFESIVALEPDDDRARFVVEEGIVDDRVIRVPDAADAVLIACPSDRIADWLVALADHQGTIFDTGSVKGSIISDVVSRLGFLPENFVPTHPIAGLERSGPQASDAALFRDRMVIVTPIASTDPGRKQRVVDWWRSIGANVEEMDPEEHDAVYALTSHLPHLLAFTYLQGISSENLAHTGGGFKDFSRIGGSDPEMWAAIFDRNRQALLAALDGFESDLKIFRTAIESADLETCLDLIRRARKLRQEI